MSMQPLQGGNGALRGWVRWLAVMECEELNRPYTVTSEQVQQYKRDGFIIIKGLLSAEILNSAREVISQQVHALNSLSHIPMEERSTYQRAFIQVINLWRKNTDVERFVRGKRVASVAAQVCTSTSHCCCDANWL